MTHTAKLPVTPRAKRSKLAAILVGAALAAALVPGAASAHHGPISSDEPVQVNASTGYASVQSSSKDYSKNSVNGQYVVPAPSPAQPVVADNPSDDGSDWSYAAIGAAGIALLLLAAGVSTKTRRRQLRRNMART